MTATMATEKRIQGLELREVETTESLTLMKGRAVPYNEAADIGWYLEEHAPGSFAKSIAESARALPLLMFHDNRSFPIGVAHEYDDNELGLDTVWRLNGSEEAQRAAQLAKDGMLNFLSIGFSPIRSEWTHLPDAQWNPDLGPAHKDRVKRLESRLLETSTVTTPAFNKAAIEWVRTGERPLQRNTSARELAEWRAELDRMRGGR